ncbi:MAG TPA: nitroreductase family protein [Bacillota bacterium]|nr:nitroreductase family protein [Bacillota bacterium]
MAKGTSNRKAAYPIDDTYIERWSPRAFSDKKVDKEVLFSLFEAARWAPSAANKQPWRFVYATEKEDRDTFLTFINDGNTIWCKKAPVLIAIVAHKRWSEDSDSVNPTYAFDTGTAWGFLALEARRQGLITHGMGGFDRDKAKETLQIPDGHEVLAIVAAGYQGDKDTLPEALQAREEPSDRNSINTFIHEGLYVRK